ncbi:MAG: sigma-54-dependent Fis family transcriptional regulator [Deltaproteobacteria bacterium]|jgi:DNA-binding NtrC family response regulator|nr:sigma-54-dependent Fis family transcriptional regulator [Deltaproteobacteria bacterium]
MHGKFLFVDDDVNLCQTVAMAMSKRGTLTSWCTNAKEALELALAEDFKCVVTDLHMDGMDGLELCRQVVEHRPHVPVIVLTAFGSMETAVAAIRVGAYDFLAKPFDVEALSLAVDRAARHFALKEEVKRLRLVVDGNDGEDPILGRSAAIRKVLDLIARVAETDASVLITGESGTGKELVARSVHNRSARKDGPFVAVNCAAMPEALLESELFGHVKGAFTDAKAARTGLFVAAQGGTLFLDEIAELPLGMQVKLLRALQERSVRPVGASTEVPFDARIITATNRDPEAEVAAGRFREDLYYRINVVRIPVPPLRARDGDILLLAQKALERFSRSNGKHVLGITPAAAERLLTYPWPGNVRELQNSMERAVALTRFDQIVIEDLPDQVREGRGSTGGTVEPRLELLPMHEVERRYILRVLQAVGGNKSQAADVLGLDRKTLYRKLEAYQGARTEGATPGRPALP